jgi:hypothetical protein
MKDLKHKKQVLADIMKFADEMELEPLRKSKVKVEVEPEEDFEQESEGEEMPMSPGDKIEEMMEGKEEKEEGDSDEEMKAKLIELYASLKD